jgi:hypothetical protein
MSNFRTFEQLASAALKYIPENEPLKAEILAAIDRSYAARIGLQERTAERNRQAFIQMLKGWGVYSLEDLSRLISETEEDIENLKARESSAYKMYQTDLEGFKAALSYSKRNHIFK